MEGDKVKKKNTKSASETSTSKKLTAKKVESVISKHVSEISADKLKQLVCKLNQAEFNKGSKKLTLPKTIRHLLQLESYSDKPDNLFEKVISQTKKTALKRVMNNQVLTEADQIILNEYLHAFKNSYLHYASLRQQLLSRETQSEDYGEQWRNSEEEDPRLEGMLRANWAKTTECAEALEKNLKKSSKILHEFSENLLSHLKANWMQPPNITLETANDKQILVVRKSVMVLSDIIPDVEAKLLSIHNLKAVHFVAKDVVYIDCNLDNSTWHGMNVLVFSKKIEGIWSNDQFFWDVSGLPGNDAFPPRAPDGTVNSADGGDGDNGKPGEDGGQILLIAEEFNELYNVVFRSKGGRGGSAQDGGNGMNGTDGIDGAEITTNMLNEDFPSPAYSSKATYSANKRTLLKSLRQKYGASFSTALTRGIDLETGETIGVNVTNNYHLKGTLKNMIAFQIGFHHRALSSRQSYLLMKGVPGTKGTVGGMGGQGGIKGFGAKSGSFIAIHFDGSAYLRQQSCKVELGDGEDGPDGNDGLNGSHGQHGKNGSDIGYIHSEEWHNPLVTVGENCQLKRFAVQPKSFCVWCEYSNGYITVVNSTGVSQRQVAPENEINNYFITRNIKTRTSTQGQDSSSTPNRSSKIDEKYAFENYKKHVEQSDLDVVLGKSMSEWWINALELQAD
ncbi:unnamed protein product [Orchesella dallaii]|uniref:Uncharacterized protein n=1 Tax=Orchesella dallaii TaxID=48710 RepID=A0ABP1R2C7_9HEXA